MKNNKLTQTERIILAFYLLSDELKEELVQQILANNIEKRKKDGNKKS